MRIKRRNRNSINQITEARKLMCFPIQTRLSCTDRSTARKYLREEKTNKNVKEIIEENNRQPYSRIHQKTYGGKRSRNRQGQGKSELVRIILEIREEKTPIKHPKIREIVQLPGHHLRREDGGIVGEERNEGKKRKEREKEEGGEKEGNK